MCTHGQEVALLVTLDHDTGAAAGTPGLSANDVFAAALDNAVPVIALPVKVRWQ